MRPHAIALALIVAILPAPRARAATCFAPGLPPQVVAGQELVLRWSDLPETVEEVEILLSLDGGRSFPVRVSSELDARSGEHRWRVPPVPTADAVLRLRMGTRDAELPGPASRAFRIACARGAPGGSCSASDPRYAGQLDGGTRRDEAGVEPGQPGSQRVDPPVQVRAWDGWAAGFPEQPTWLGPGACSEGPPSGLRSPEARLEATDPTLAQAPPDPVALGPPLCAGNSAMVPAGRGAPNAARVLSSHLPRAIPLRI